MTAKIRLPALVLLLASAVGFQPRSAAAQNADPRIEVKCHVFQVAQDAPVVPGRSTVIRVYADWTAETDPSDAEQLSWYDAVVKIEAGGVTLEEMPWTFFRPDQHAKTDSIYGTLSANHFGWSPPAGAGVHPVRAVVTLQSPETQKKFEYDASCPVEALPSSPALTIDYFMVRTAEWWGDGTPQNLFDLVEAAAHQMMENAIEFAGLNLPIGSIGTRYRGIFGYDEYFTGLDTKFVEEDGSDVASALWDATREVSADADVIVGIVPPGLETDDDWAGAMYAFDLAPFVHHSQRLGGKRVILLKADGLGFNFTDVPTLAHELGHFYGLCHTSGFDDSQPGTRMGAILEIDNCVTGRVFNEGFSVSPGGGGGTNKSETEGNPDTNPDDILPLMFPVKQLPGSAFITVAQYGRLIENFKELGLFGAAGSGAGQGVPEAPEPGTDGWSQVGGPSADAPTQIGGPSVVDRFDPIPPTERRAPTPHVIVSGRVDTDGTVSLVALQYQDREPGTVTDGSYGLEIRDAQGGLLDSTGFDVLHAASADAPAVEVGSFTVAAPYRADMAEVVILRDGAPVARRKGEGAPPQVSIVSPGPNEAWSDDTVIQWEGSDPDGDPLAYDIYYSPDGTSWTGLAIHVPGVVFEGIGPGDLQPGPNPRLRVVALDGFHTTVAETAVLIEGGFRLIATLPAPDDTVSASEAVVRARFNRALQGSSVSGSGQLVGDDGSVITATLESEPDRMSVRLRPEAPLSPGRRYEVSVTGDMRDAFGNGLDQAVTWSFHTDADAQPPRITWMAPSDRALAWPVDRALLVRFDEPVAAAAIEGGGIRVETSDGTAVGGTWRWVPEQKMAVFGATGGWTEKTTYRVMVTEAVTDEAGNPVRAPEPWTFTTAGAIRPRGGS